MYDGGWRKFTDTPQTHVFLEGTVKHPVDVSYNEFFTASSADITCSRIPMKKKLIDRKQHFPLGFLTAEATNHERK
jgi:hypothetical protein